MQFDVAIDNRCHECIVTCEEEVDDTRFYDQEKDGREKREDGTRRGVVVALIYS